MTISLRGLGFVLLGALAASRAEGQTACPAPPGGEPLVATLTSPPAGSTLPAGPVTFTWCHASADYFLTIETVRGAADIYNAFPVGVDEITLGTACAPTAPTGCIPQHGETIYVTLWTDTSTKGKKNFVAAPTVTYTAPNTTPPPPAATTTTVGAIAAGVPFSAGDQSLTLTATVTSTAVVNQGTVTFRVLDGAAILGSPVTSAALAAGAATVTYLLPGGTAAAIYTIEANYSGGTSFLSSTGTQTFAVNPPAPVAAPTTTAVANVPAPFSDGAQDVTFSATVSSGSVVNEGTILFQVVDALNAPVGSPVASATLTDGSASVIYSLPAGLPAGNYTIQASYSGGTNFLASGNAGTLAISPPPPPVQLATATGVQNTGVPFDTADRIVTLTAVVTVPNGPVNQGTVTFQLLDAAANPAGPAIPSVTLTNGSAAVTYPLAGGLGAGDYQITATYSGGTDFLSSSGAGALRIDKIASTTIFTSTAPGALAFNGTYAPAATSNGDGTLTYGASGTCSIAGGTVTMTSGSGACVVTASISEGPNYLGSSAEPQTISAMKAEATVTIADQSVVYDGQPHALAATTNPEGLALVYSHGLDSTPPTNVNVVAGTVTPYVVVATIDDGNYSGSGSALLTIAKAASTTAFSSAAPATLPFDGTYAPAATSSGDGTLTYGATGSCALAGGIVTITSGSGSCVVTASASEGVNYLGSSAEPQTIAAAKAVATVEIANQSFVYDGLPHAATGTTTPAGLAVTYSYNGSAAPPVDVAGAPYVVVATIDDANYTGSGSGSLTMTKAPSTVAFGTIPGSLPSGGTYSVVATTNGDGEMTYAVSGACSLADGVVTMGASGVCTLTASESEGPNRLGSTASASTTVAAPPEPVYDVLEVIEGLKTKVRSLEIGAPHHRKHRRGGRDWDCDDTGSHTLLDTLNRVGQFLERGRREEAIAGLERFIDAVEDLEECGRIDHATARALILEARRAIECARESRLHRGHDRDDRDRDRDRDERSDARKESGDRRDR